MKIGYVEDDRDARQIFGERLQSQGHSCSFFDRAEELLEAITPGAFDVLITDIRLPGISGIDLIRKLRGRSIQTPCILITAFNSLEHARDALNASANYLLEKPFKFESLMKAIQKVTTENLSVQHCADRGLAELQLTERESEIARLLLKGLSNAEIADILRISEKTVKQYLTQVFLKANVSGRGEFFSSIFPV